MPPKANLDSEVFRLAGDSMRKKLAATHTAESSAGVHTGSGGIPHRDRVAWTHHPAEPPGTDLVAQRAAGGTPVQGRLAAVIQTMREHKFETAAVAGVLLFLMTRPAVRNTVTSFFGSKGSAAITDGDTATPTPAPGTSSHESAGGAAPARTQRLGTGNAHSLSASAMARRSHGGSGAFAAVSGGSSAASAASTASPGSASRDGGARAGGGGVQEPYPRSSPGRSLRSGSMDETPPRHAGDASAEGSPDRTGGLGDAVNGASSDGVGGGVGAGGSAGVAGSPDSAGGGSGRKKRPAPLAARIGDLQAQVDALTRELEGERDDHDRDVAVLTGEAQGALQMLLRQQRAVRRFAERVDGVAVDDAELSYAALDESVASLTSIHDSPLDDISFERLLVRIAASGGGGGGGGAGAGSVGHGAGGGGDASSFAGGSADGSGLGGSVDMRDDEIMQLRSQIERLSGLNQLLQSRLSSAQRDLRDAHALVGDVGAMVPTTADEIRIKMDLTIALIKGEVIALDWPGLELASRLLQEMKGQRGGGSAALPPSSGAGSNYQRAFDSSLGVVRDVVVAQAGEQLPENRWDIANLDEFLAKLPSKEHRRVFKALQRLVIAYDALPNASKNHLPTARETVANCHNLLELARYCRYKLAAKKAARMSRRTTVMTSGELSALKAATTVDDRGGLPTDLPLDASVSSIDTAGDKGGLSISMASMESALGAPDVPIPSAAMASPGSSRRLQMLLHRRPSAQELMERRILHPGPIGEGGSRGLSDEREGKGDESKGAE